MRQPKSVGVAIALFVTCASGLAHAQDTHASDEAPTEASPAEQSRVESPPVESPPVEEPASPPRRKPVRFGDAGVFLVTSSSVIGVSRTTFANSGAESFSAYFSPGLDYFIARHVSLGVDLAIAYGDGRGYAADSSLVRAQTTSFSGGPRVGFDLPLGKYFSFYPRLTVGVETIRREDTVVAARSNAPPSNSVGIPSTSRDGPWINVFAPLLLHPTPHFFIGLGPTFFHAFARVRGGPEIGGERTTVGGNLVFGVWWGGEGEVDSSADSGSGTEPEAERAPAFGEAGQLAFSSDFGLGFSRTSYAGTGTSTQALSIAPGIDWFASRHVALGLGIQFSSTDATGLRPDGTRTTVKTSGGGVAFRLGVDVPITKLLSFFPRGALSFGSRTYETRAASDGYEYAEAIGTASLFTPLLVHPAPHGFVGFGPYVAHDLVRQIESSKEKNPATSFGANLVVGGWL